MTNAKTESKYSAPSREDCATVNEFKPLKEGAYILEVKEVKEEERNKYQSSDITTFIDLCFWVNQSCEGKEIKDMDGEVQEEGFRQLWESLDINSHGFKANGDPAKTRACLCALLGQDIEEGFSFDSIEDLSGKKVKAYVTVGKKLDGTPKNKIISYSVVE